MINNTRSLLRYVCRVCAVVIAITTYTYGASETTLRVAVASNFAATAEQLLTDYDSPRNTVITFSAASSGALYAQILHGAPFDVFLSADAQRPIALESKGLILANSRKTYAEGLLAVYSLTGLPLSASRPDLMTWLQETDRLAIANPKTAPYGYAAQQYLLKLGFWDKLAKNLIKGTSVLQATQFVQTGNVDRALTAYHLIENKHQALVLERHDYPAIKQQLVILQRSKQVELAQHWVDYLLGSEVQAALVKRGYAEVKP